MVFITEHAFTLDQLAAYCHGELDIDSVPVVTREISEEEAALRAFLADGGDIDDIEPVVVESTAFVEGRTGKCCVCEQVGPVTHDGYCPTCDKMFSIFL